MALESSNIGLGAIQGVLHNMTVSPLKMLYPILISVLIPPLRNALSNIAWTHNLSATWVEYPFIKSTTQPNGGRLFRERAKTGKFLSQNLITSDVCHSTQEEPGLGLNRKPTSSLFSK